MNRIEEMIKEMCPDGVRRVRLGEVCNSIKTGKLNANAMDPNGLYPFFTCDANPTTINNYAFDTEAIIVTGNGSQVGHINYYKGKFNAYQRTYVLSDFIEINIFYVLHYFKGYLKDYIMANSKKGSIPYITLPMLQSFEIPLPPLPIQQEIVKILDSFTALQQNLEDELKLRQKQYEHYCDKLYGGDYEGMMNMDGVDKTKVVAFDDLGIITRGKRFVRDDVREEGQPCIHYGDMYTYYGTKASTTKTHLDRDFPKKMRYANKGDVVIVGAGENNYDIGVGLVWMGDEPAAVHDACYILEHNINPMYISYYLRSNIYHLQLKKYVSEGKICSFSGKDLGRIKIPVQSPEKQSQIVQTLDHFESLISNIKTEIELRKKQYEYYREKLLTF